MSTHCPFSSWLARCINRHRSGFGWWVKLRPVQGDLVEPVPLPPNLHPPRAILKRPRIGLIAAMRTDTGVTSHVFLAVRTFTIDAFRYQLGPLLFVHLRR